MAGVKPKLQLGLEEQVLEDADLEALLEQRESQKQIKKIETARFQELDKTVKVRIGDLELVEGTVARCGRFTITVKSQAGHSVEFTTDAGRRIDIKPDKE